MYQCVFTSLNKVLENLTKQTLFCLIKYHIKGVSYCYLSPHSTVRSLICQPPFTESHNILTDTTFSGTITFKGNTVIEYNETNITELLLLTTKVHHQCKGGEIPSLSLFLPHGTSLRGLTISPGGMTHKSVSTPLPNP